MQHKLADTQTLVQQTLHAIAHSDIVYIVAATSSVLQILRLCTHLDIHHFQCHRRLIYHIIKHLPMYVKANFHRSRDYAYAGLHKHGKVSPLSAASLFPLLHACPLASSPWLPASSPSLLPYSPVRHLEAQATVRHKKQAM